jgi:hypothetical protein
MDLDLWIKIAKKYSFKKIDNLLSISLRHDSAKSHAFAERTYIDVAMVYVRHGREDKAREVLQRQADRLAEYERELAVAGKIPLLRRFLRAAMNVIGCTAL